MDAIYARQSVDKADSLSIQGQIDLCRRETGANAKVYQDKGYSGKNTNRPAFRRLMADVERGLIGKIVVYRLDRFSRSIADFGRLWEVLSRCRVEFVSIHETFDTSTPMGRAMLNIIMVFAQLERETTAQRVKDNYYQRAGLGAWPGGPAPYGFQVGRLPGPDGVLLPSLLPDGHASQVEELFSAYAQPEATLGSVVRALNAAGIPGPRRAVWDNVALSRILHSPAYVRADREVYVYYQARGVSLAQPPEAFDGRRAGLLVGKRDRAGAGDGEGPRLSLSLHEGLISAQLWLTCQYKLERNRQLGGQGRGKHTWLSGLLKCGVCGYAVKVNREGSRRYLQCSGRSNLKVCRASIRADLSALERAVAAHLEEMLHAQRAEPPARDPETDRALRSIEEKIGRLIAALAGSSAVTAAHIDRAVQALEAERQALQARVPRPTRPPRFSALSFEEKKQTAARYIREIRLTGSQAAVVWRSETAVEPVSLFVVEEEGHRAEGPGQRIDPVEHQDAVGERHGDGEEAHPHHTPKDQHHRHGHDGAPRAPEHRRDRVGEGQEEEKERGGAGLGHTDTNDLRIGVEGGDELGSKEEHRHTDELGQHHRGPDAEPRPLPGPLVLRGAQVLADKGGEGHGEAGDGQEAEALDLGVGAHPGHGQLPEGVDVGLDHYVGKGDDGALEPGGQAHLDDLTEKPGRKTHLPQVQPVVPVGAEQLDETEKGTDQLGDHRGDGRPLHPHAKAPDEGDVQHDIDQRGHDQVIERVAAVPHGLEDTHEDIVHHKAQGPGEIDAQIGHRVSHDHLRGGHEPEDLG